jgi:hypothetical protein
MSTQPDQSAVEILAEWKGDAIHHPGVLFEESQAELLSTVENVAAIADWIAVTAISGVNSDSANDAVNRKVIDFLKGWRGRFGQARLDEVRKRLLFEMQKYRANSKMTDKELDERIKLLFDEIDG